MGAAASDYFTPYADVQYGFLDEELGIVNLHQLATKGDFHRVRACLKKGLDPNGPAFDDDGAYVIKDTPMICAARGNSFKRGRKRHLQTLDVLLHFGGDVNKCNFLGQTPLSIACEKNLVSIVQWLVTHGSDVNKSTKVGESPMLCAYRNGNLAIVKLLLDHGAKVIDPLRDFGSSQFPTIAKELRGENPGQRRGREDVRSSDSSERDDHEAVRPVSSYIRIRPLWKPVINADDPPTSPTARPTTAAVPTTHEQMRQEISSHQQQQQQQRDVILSDLDEKRRLTEQREYCEHLAVDNAQRKATRRRQREKATYDKYVARVEETRQQHLVQPGRVVSSHDRHQNNSDATAVVGLHWSTEASRHRSIRTAPSRLGRPMWVAHPVYTTHVGTSSSSSSSEGDELLLRESRKVFETLQAEQDRRDRLRASYTAPLSTLPPLG